MHQTPSTRILLIPTHHPRPDPAGVGVLHLGTSIMDWGIIALLGPVVLLFCAVAMLKGSIAIP